MEISLTRTELEFLKDTIKEIEDNYLLILNVRKQKEASSEMYNTLVDSVLGVIKQVIEEPVEEKYIWLGILVQLLIALNDMEQLLEMGEIDLLTSILLTEIGLSASILGLLLQNDLSVEKQNIRH